GTPMGLKRGMVLEYRLPAIPQMDFTESGSWLFKVEQNMRVHTLPGVLDIGLSLEKEGEKF
ncbi:MAG: gliding motility lipoprotein GldH, partial [Bacteroidota bacterium]|nr:gliding motility lipoprotein GldH [Bacteroidota bacterium]MDX5431269.1 gliding motility lipoprotein GldH [Bacteroidota bacterium]MDX5470008.1 gliding motility lipoprotein GldH [Bacteroidota bacterium]